MKKTFTKAWFKASGVRALKTVAQTALGVIGTSAAMAWEVNWTSVIGASLLAGIISIITSVAGLPEVDKKEV